MSDTVCTFEEMLGLTFIEVKQGTSDKRRSSGNDALIFTAEDGRKFIFSHDQDCCEDVSIEDIAGDLNDLVGAPLLQAEEVVSPAGYENSTDEDHDSWTWTFYKFATIKGYVTVRWYGSSNGYYSESVSFWIEE